MTTGRSQAEGCVHLIAPEIRSGVRCGNAGECNATTDVASVTCIACLNLHNYGRTNGPGQLPRKRCKHAVTRGINGAKGSWCAGCGAKVLEVHNRPCGECRHFFTSGGYHGCRHHLMAVTPEMLVTYYLVPGPGRPALCFEPADGQDA